MKYLLLALLLLPLVGAAQTAGPPPAAVVAPYRYCALVVDDLYFSANNRLALDYGQDVKGAPVEPEMTKNIRRSSSVIDALNYLSRHGWELLDVTNVPSDLSSPVSRHISSETHYLHRRRASLP